LLDAALAVPFDPEEEDRRQLALARQATWDQGAVSPSVVDIAPEPAFVPDPLVAEADAAMGLPPAPVSDGLEPALPTEDGGSGGPALPQADEDLPPVSQPGAGGMEQGVTRQGGGRRSASALLAEVLPLEQGAGSMEQGATAGGGGQGTGASQAAPRRRSAAALLAEIPEDSGVLRRAGDVPIFIAQGITTGLKGLTDAFGADNAASQALAANQDFYQAQLSPEAQASQQRVAQIQAAAADQGVMAQLGAAGRAFAESPTAFVAQGVGTMAPTIALGAAGKAVGLGARGVQAVQTATGATMGGGIVKGEIYQAVEQAMLQAGRSPEEAAEAASTAQAYGGENLDQILAGYGLGALATAIGAERLAGRAIAGAAAPTGGVLRVAGRTALQEALPEAAQGGQEQLARNLAQQREDFNVPTMRGVVGAGALEGLAGLAIGGPAGVAAGAGAAAGRRTAQGTGVGGQETGTPAPAAAPAPVRRVVVEADDVFGEATTAAVSEPGTGSMEPGAGDERFAPPPAAEQPAPATAEENLFGEVEQRGETIVTPPPAPVVSDLGALPTVELPVNELRLSRDVPNFKEGADEATGVVEGERLEGTFQRLGTAPIIVWERTDGQREIISGRHRWDLAKRTGEQTIPSQVVREADGFTQGDALALDAELNIRDGQGSIKDYANYFRNAQIDREAATQGGLLSRAKGRAGFEIGRSAGNDLYSAFANGAVSADKAAAIAAAAPNNDAVQRAALARAGNMTAEQLPGFVRVVAGMTTGPAETQTDLFGADDTALVQAERLSKAANAKARELQQQITAVRGAARRPEAAAKMGVNVQDPEGVRRRIGQLEGEVERYRNFHQYPEVMAELQTLRVQEGADDLSLAGPDAQAYFNFADVPESKQPAGQEAVDAAAEASSVPYAPAPVSARQGVDRSGELRSARERQGIAYRALLAGDAETVAAAIRDGVPLSRLMLGFIGREPASFNIRGAIIKSPQDLALYNLAHRTPFFESLKIAVLDDRRQVIASQVVSTGTLNEALAHPRDILAVIEAARATNPKAKIGGFMIMHNHPSGDPTPSEADRQMTRRLQLAGETIGVPLVDHVITNGEQYFSFSESNTLIGDRGGNFARIGSKPKLSVLPPATGEFRPGATAKWEVAPASTMAALRINASDKLQTVRTLLQTADPGMVHILNLDTRFGIISVDRYPIGTKPEEMVRGSIAQGTYAVAISMPDMVPTEQSTLVRGLRTGMKDVFNIHVVDAMGGDNKSYYERGLLEEPAVYGRGDRVAEEPTRTKPRQLEEKAMRNEALAAETRARLGSEYLPISLNAQAEAAKEWINTNGLDAAKLRIAQLSGEDSVPTPLDFAIGIEAAGRLSAVGDHQGAADIVSTMSHRATGMGQTISTLAMMARLSPEGIVFYGENIIRRYINALPPEAQDRIRALQAEVARLKAELAQAKFDQGSEVIRSGKLGDEKMQDRIKRRQRAKVTADLGPAASGPEVTAETRARVISMNRAVRDVLLGDATKAEATKAIEAILLEQGNLSASEAAAMAKSITDAFFKLMRETRTRLTNEAKGRGGRAGGFDRLLAALREGKDISDADFLGEISRLLGLPGMTPGMARELRAIGQRYERATDPDVRLVLAAQMYEKAHELVPADFWVKVRGFAYLSMLFAPKTWIRNVVGNQIQWIANVGRDAFVTGLLDPAMSMFTGQRTSAGLQLGARLKGLLAPVADVRRGYLWSKQENPSANHFQNFMAGVNHLRLLSKLSSQNKYEISDVRSVNGRIFSSGFMRSWEAALSIALGAGDRAFWMSQFKASMAQMQAAAEKNGEWSGQPTPEMIEAAMAEAAYAIYQNPNLLSQGGAKLRGVLNRWTTAGRTDQFGLGTALMAFTQVPGSIALRGILDWSPVGFIRAMYQGMRGVLYASSEGRRGAKFDQAEFNKTFTQALLGTGGMYAAGFWLYSLGIITASREDDEDLEAMRRASGLGSYRINLTALRRALLSMNWFTPQPPQDGDMIVTYDWAQPVAITVAAGAEYAAMLERAERSALKKGLTERASMAAMSLVAGAKSLEELPLLSGLMSFMQAAGQRAPAGESSLANAVIKTVTGLPSMFVPQLVRQATQLSDNMIRTTRAGVAAEREFDRVLASLPGWSTKYPVRFDVTGQAIERYQYGGNTVWNVLTNPTMTTRYKADPVLQEVGRLLNATGEAGVVPREVMRKATINGQSVELTNNQIAAYQYYVGNFTMSHFRWRMAAPVYAKLPDELKAKMLSDDLKDIHAAVKSAVLGADARRLTRRQMFLRQALVNSPLGRSVPPK
jgi:hypothetical protein